jgi:uncharacterized membrane protein
MYAQSKLHIKKVSVSALKEYDAGMCVYFIKIKYLGNFIELA